MLAFRRAKNEEATKTVRLRGLNPDARYEVTGVAPEPRQITTGKALLEQGVTIEIGMKAAQAAVPGHAVVTYRKL